VARETSDEFAAGAYLGTKLFVESWAILRENLKQKRNYGMRRKRVFNEELFKSIRFSL